ncbi:MAG: hypothetical protein JW891_08225 [Candidatus Lokiarchaeota archaeon]|nr:hypothetical protein [Candidatus Lokiarchaeota archaeon]
MSSCNNLKDGDVIVCEHCGLEMTITKACGCGEDDAACSEEGFNCCGKPMKKK